MSLLEIQSAKRILEMQLKLIGINPTFHFHRPTMYTLKDLAMTIHKIMEQRANLSLFINCFI